VEFHHIYNKPPKVLEAFPQLAGDFPRAWEVSNMLVFNKRRTWEECFALVLEFWRGWVVVNGMF